MALFSGNPADRAMGGVPGSVAEASRSSGMSNGTARNNSFGGTLGRDLGDRGFRSDTGGVRTGSMKDQGRIASLSVNSAGKGDYMGSVADRQATVSGLKQPSKMSTGPVSRNIQPSVSSPAPKMMSSIQDYKSIVPGRVTFTDQKVPFAQKNPSLSKYLGGTPAKPVNVTVDEAKKMAGTVQKSGAFISGANWAAQMGLPKSSLAKVGTKTSGYETTTVSAGPAKVDISYPKTVATGVRVGTFTPAPKMSTGPVSRNYSKSSTGPVSRGFSPAPKMSSGPVSRGVQGTAKSVPMPKARPTTVEQVRKQSQKSKTAGVMTKNGYTYTKVRGKYQNFGAGSMTNTPKGRNK